MAELATTPVTPVTPVIPTLDFEPDVAPVNTQMTPQALDFEPDSSSQLSGYPGQPKVTQAELDAAPEGIGDTPEQFTGSFDPSKDMSLIPGSPENLQADQDRLLGKQYKDYQSGQVIQSPEAMVRSDALPENLVPSTDMYEGSQDPWKMYNDMASKADSHTLLGDPVLKGKVLPKPGDYSWYNLDKSPLSGEKSVLNTPFGVSPKLASLTGDAARESIKNLLVTAAAALDEAAGTDYMAKSVDQWIASPPEAKAPVDGLIKDGVKITAATILGAKAGATAGSSMNWSEKYSQALAGLSSLVGAISVLNPDDPTVITGKNALAPMLTGIPIDDKGKFSQQILAKKFNQLEDAVALGLPMAKGAEVAGWVGGFLSRTIVQPITYGLSSSAREKKVTQDILYHLDGKDSGSVDKLIQYIQAHKQEVFDLGGLGTDTATLNRTPMSAIAEGATKDNKLLANKAQEVEAGGLRSGISSLITKKEEPLHEMNTVLDNAVTSRGGLNTIDKTSQMMANQAIEKVDTATGNLKATQLKTDADLQAAKTQADANLENTKVTQNQRIQDSQNELNQVNSELDRIYKSDPTFAATIEQLSKDSGIDVAGKFRAGEVNKVMPELVNSVRIMKKKKNDLYEAIPEGVPIDEQSFVDNVVPLIKNKWLTEGLEESILTRLKDQKLGLDFKYAYKKLLPKINGEIGREISLGTDAIPEKIAALKALSHNISSTQVDILSRSSDKSVSSAATAARDFYKNTYVKYTRDPETPVGRLFAAYDDAFDEHLAKMGGDEGKDIIGIGHNYRMSDEAQNVVENGVNDNKRGSAQQVIDFMSNPDYKGDKTGLIKVYKGEVAGAIADVLSQNGGDMTLLDPNLVYKTLKDKGVVLKQNFPEEVKQIDTFIQSFRQGRMSQEQATKTLEQVKKEGADVISSVEKSNKELLSSAKDQAKAEVKAANKGVKKAQREVDKSVLNKFVEKTPDGMIPKQNGFDVFKNLLRKDNNENKIGEIVRRVKESNDPEAQKGLESAWLAHVEDSIHASVNNKKANVTNANKLLSNKTSLLKYGKMIFGNNPDPKESAKSLEALNVYVDFIDKVMKEQTKTSSTSIPLGDKLKVESEAVSAFGYLTKFVFGALSRTGLKVSSTGGRVLKSSNPDTHAMEVRDMLLSDPEYATKMFGVVRDAMNGGLSPEIKKAILQGIILTGKQKANQGLRQGLDYLTKPDDQVPDGLK